MLTLDQAITKLNEITAPGKTYTTQQLKDLVKLISLDAAPGFTQGSVTLLYSGSINGVSSTAYIEKMVTNGADIRVIDKTHVGQFLASDDFRSKWINISSEAALFHGSIGPWAQASGRFVADTVGEVRLLGFNASSTSVFVNTELEALRNNTRITTVEGLSQAELKAKSFGDALSELKVRSADSFGLSGFKVNVSAPGVIQSVDVGDFFNRQVLNHAEYAKLNPSAAQKLSDFLSGNALTSEAKTTLRAAGKTFGIAGAVLLLGFALSDSAQAAESGNPDKARKIMEDWALDAAGSTAGATIGAAIVGIAAAAAVAAGVVVSAPVLAGLAIGAAIVGGFYGSTAATQAWERFRGSADNDQLNLLEKLLAKVALPEYGLVFGTANADTLTGSAKADYLFGGAGGDVLNGMAGNDVLRGGKDNDTYNFTGSWGKDIVIDSDGLGQIKIDGKEVGTAKGAGKRGVWVADLGGGNFADLTVYDDASSSTGKKLIITRASDAANTITINNFNLTKAEGNEGYLGIKLDPTQRIAIVQGDGTSVGASKPNVWADNNFNATSLDGKSSNVNEGTGKAFNIYLAQGAKAGDTITLALDGDAAAELKAKINGAIVDADGAVFTLTEGQVMVSFTLLQDEEITDDLMGNISASYEGEDDSVESNTWALTLKDAGEVDNTFNGDFLVKTEINIGAPINRTNLDDQLVEVVGFDKIFYVRDNQGNLAAGSEDPTFKPIYDQDGNVIGQEEVPSDDETVTDNTIYGTAGKDKINGLTGKDLLSGGAGNDQIDGGAGDDMIGGGAGSDTIEGGDGNDYISSSANVLAGRQSYGPLDRWSKWGMPADTEPLANGGTWGVYVGDEAGGGKVTIWSGIGSTDTGSTDGDVIDAGAGDDKVIASWGDDRIMGGDGKDQLDGLAGNDIIEGGEGDDTITADGLVKTGYLNSTDAANHGADFVDGGAGRTSHYECRSCLRPNLLVKTSIRYPKTAPKASPDACASRRRARSRIQNTPNSIAACARKQGVVAIFYDGGAI